MGNKTRRCKSTRWEEEVPHTQEAILNKITKNAKKIGKSKLWSIIQALPKWKVIKALKSKRLTCRRSNWIDWKNSKFKQLDQYHKQQIFGKLQKLPKGANVLPLIWTYLIKDCGTKKA
jgi:hypothetical protein